MQVTATPEHAAEFQLRRSDQPQAIAPARVRSCDSSRRISNPSLVSPAPAHSCLTLRVTRGIVFGARVKQAALLYGGRRLRPGQHSHLAPNTWFVYDGRLWMDALHSGATAHTAQPPPVRLSVLTRDTVIVHGSRVPRTRARRCRGVEIQVKFNYGRKDRA